MTVVIDMTATHRPALDEVQSGRLGRGFLWDSWYVAGVSDD